MEPPRAVAVHGVIGIGKSTLLGTLKQRGYEVVPEPVDAWGGALRQFYEDPKRNSFLLQARILAELVEGADRQAVRKAADCKGGLVFFERSCRGARIFIDAAVESGNMTREELNTYNRLEEMMMRFRRHHQVPTDVVLYLDAATCCRRIRARDRSSEKDGPLMHEDESQLRYLQQLEDHQNKLFPDAIRVDARGTPEEVADRFLESIIKL